MQKWILVLCLISISLGACNILPSATHTSANKSKTKTIAAVVPVKKPRTKTEKQQQDRFIKTSTKRFKSRQKAGAYYVAKAKRNYNQEKIDSAKYLFGRAWILDSTNADIYWGYGKVYGEQKQYDKALAMLNKALKNDKNNPRLLTDIATSHLGRYYQTSNPEDLQKSKKLLEKAVKLDPTKAEAHYKLAISSYYLREYNKAWDNLHKSVKQDKSVADARFITALLHKQQDPKGIYKKQRRK
ncbi:tetratricopeptide repeat protein [Pontibacter vulgaris]|uniref:tetratricopeptide repeat protein n=1 Tax=Pontibacter vulgaris TaxID=2905679 RepID=UPI001FA6FCC0|nr:tetratricopeptide repeat protein [Pontibacter vulgaris]